METGPGSTRYAIKVIGLVLIAAALVWIYREKGVLAGAGVLLAFI